MKTQAELMGMDKYELMNLVIKTFPKSKQVYAAGDLHKMAAACLAEIEELGLWQMCTKYLQDGRPITTPHPLKDIQMAIRWLLIKAATNPKAIIIAALMAAESEGE